MTRIVPLADKELSRWRAAATAIPDPELRYQALASLTQKRFHAVGGSAYSLFLPPGDEIKLIRPIVAFQTISDYLDNLCDRSIPASQLDARRSGVDFRQLHCAMLDAVHPGARRRPYYRFHPQKNDGGYLEALVHTCQEALSEFPGYRLVRARVAQYVRRYNDLQEFKHIAPAQRIPSLEKWFGRWCSRSPGLNSLHWWEFAAACGSTLGIFALWAAAARAASDGAAEPCYRLKEIADQIDHAYFPWISGFHILLDYYIDQSEDRENGDLNLVSFYSNPSERLARLSFFYQEASRQAAGLVSARIHGFIVNGLPAVYLTDPKVPLQHYEKERKVLLSRTGRSTRLLAALCALLRHVPALADGRGFGMPSRPRAGL